jgi:hypothetical protein
VFEKQQSSSFATGFRARKSVHLRKRWKKLDEAAAGAVPLPLGLSFPLKTTQ